METIEEKAREYAEKLWRDIGDFNEDHVTFENIVTSSFIAGYSCLQEVIEYLKNEIDLYKNELKELKERERIAFKVINEKNKQIERT